VILQLTWQNWKVNSQGHLCRLTYCFGREKTRGRLTVGISQYNQQVNFNLYMEKPALRESLLCACVTVVECG